MESFKAEAHALLAPYGSTPSRVVRLDQARKQLASLSLLQKELFDQALTCIEVGVFRAAHVMAWAAFIDYLESRIGGIGLPRIHAVRPAWSKYGTVEELRENLPEYQIIEALRDVGLLGKSEAKTLQGLLSKRNECAHPGAFTPDANESIGYVSELLARIRALDSKPA